MRIWWLIMLLLLAGPASGQAAAAQTDNENPQRAYNLYNDIRCPVCNGQSIAESDVGISISLREYVDQSILAGDTDDTIKQNLVARYGQDILFEPALTRSTFVLWAVPWIAGIALIWFVMRQSRKSQDTAS